MTILSLEEHATSKATSTNGVSRRTRLRVLLPITAIAIAASIWSGSDRVSSGPALGDKFSGKPISARGTATSIRIGSFNIHSGIGTDGRLDLDRTAESLAGLDLIALNEVRGPDWRGNPNQSQQLGERLQLPWLFAPTERQWWHDHFGNGVLASLPVSHWIRIPLPCSRGKGHRNALLLTVTIADRPLHVVITHLDRGEDRTAQLKTATALFLSLAEPAILMGDLNSTAADPLMHNLLQSPGVTDPLESHRQPAGRIDWILTRGLRHKQSGTRDGIASDHPVVWTELELVAQP